MLGIYRATGILLRRSFPIPISWGAAHHVFLYLQRLMPYISYLIKIDFCTLWEVEIEFHSSTREHLSSQHHLKMLLVLSWGIRWLQHGVSLWILWPLPWICMNLSVPLQAYATAILAPEFPIYYLFSSLLQTSLLSRKAFLIFTIAPFSIPWLRGESYYYTAGICP